MVGTGQIVFWCPFFRRSYPKYRASEGHQRRHWDKFSCETVDSRPVQVRNGLLAVWFTVPGNPSAIVRIRLVADRFARATWKPLALRRRLSLSRRGLVSFIPYVLGTAGRFMIHDSDREGSYIAVNKRVYLSIG